MIQHLRKIRTLLRLITYTTATAEITGLYAAHANAGALDLAVDGFPKKPEAGRISRSHTLKHLLPLVSNGQSLLDIGPSALDLPLTAQELVQELIDIEILKPDARCDSSKDFALDLEALILESLPATKKILPRGFMVLDTYNLSYGVGLNIDRWQNLVSPS